MMNSVFKQSLINAINNVLDNPTDDNKDSLKKYFGKNFDNNRTAIFELFKVGEDGTSILSLEQQKILFDSLEKKQRRCNKNKVWQQSAV